MRRNEDSDYVHPVVRLSATAEEEVDPDTAVFSIRFSRLLSTKEKCDADYAEEKRKVVRALARFGLDSELKSSGYRCVKVEKKRGVIQGYRYVDDCALEIPREKNDIPAILSALQGCGAHSSIGLRYILRNERQMELSLAAKAVEESRVAAELLANAAGAKIAGVKSIEYRDFSYSPGRAARMCMSAPSGPDNCFEEELEVDLTPAPVEVEANVDVEWMLEE